MKSLHWRSSCLEDLSDFKGLNLMECLRIFHRRLSKLIWLDNWEAATKTFLGERSGDSLLVSASQTYSKRRVIWLELSKEMWFKPNLKSFQILWKAFGFPAFEWFDNEWSEVNGRIVQTEWSKSLDKRPGLTVQRYSVGHGVQSLDKLIVGSSLLTLVED